MLTIPTTIQALKGLFRGAIVVILILMNSATCDASTFIRSSDHYSAKKEVQSRHLEITVNNQEGIVRITMAKTVKGKGVLKITNPDGEVVYDAKVRTWDGSTVIDLEQSELGKGTFRVQIILETASLTGKFEIK